jgi:hypothetical protein
MGCDYLLMRATRKRGRVFPCASDEIPEADLCSPLPWSVFREWLLSIGGRENGSSDSIWVDYPGNEGVIEFSGGGDNPESVYLDVHAHLRRVLEAFEKMIELEDECVIHDPQVGVFHNEQSFVEFIARESKDGK